ncbi:MAG: hypothetical protein EP344_15195 [Bacteroidetes bacterium]|nr:MAG: hypothetical protein EP344_15195 [Bacteroidota bacterium]
MKKIGIALTAFIVFSLAWMAFVREPLPPVPVIRGAISEEVDLNFSINTMNATGLELSLNNKVAGKGMYVQFQMGNAWKTGRTGLVVKGIKGNSAFSGGVSPQSYLNDPKRKEKKEKDFSDFMKDNRGKAVSTYAFKQTLVEGQDGKTYMLLVYGGPAMEMIQTLEVAQPITLPAHISKLFLPKGNVQFQRGTVALDKSTNGFYIPVVIR